jgi:hypothetical protein
VRAQIARHDDAPGRLYVQNHGGWADWTGPGGGRTSACCAATATAGRGDRSPDCLRTSGFPIVTSPARRRRSYASCPSAGDALLSRRRARGVAQRMAATRGPARSWAAEE